MIVLPANTNDASALCALVNSAYRGDLSKQGWTTEADLLRGQRTDIEKLREMIMDSNSVILKAINDKGNTLVGCVYLRKNEADCYLGMLTVKPNMQNNNLGKKILEASEAHAKYVMNCKSISMTVISVRSELIQWYQRRGYELTNERRPFPMNDPRFGIPKVKSLEFIVLRKNL
ncbi:MAG: GNAT family N-acetyltransferase [Oligoflexia bacterium]|nr:GNAT family N-acetyltransferase [Oligoflexia bacterium]